MAVAVAVVAEEEEEVDAVDINPLQSADRGLRICKFGLRVTPRFRISNPQSLRGQALIEFLIGIIGIIALFAGLLQIASLSRAHTESMIEARSEAAEDAIGDTAFLASPDYIEAVMEGADGTRYSADDSFTDGSSADFLDYIVEPSASSATEWAIIDGATGNQLSMLRSGLSPAYEMQMVRGTDSRDVDIIPAVQNLIYDAETIEVQSTVWLPWLGGIY